MLKMMLEGKMPMNLPVSSNEAGERIVYRVEDNKENSLALEEELKNKEELLRNEQEEK